MLYIYYAPLQIININEFEHTKDQSHTFRLWCFTNAHKIRGPVSRMHGSRMHGIAECMVAYTSMLYIYYAPLQIININECEHTKDQSHTFRLWRIHVLLMRTK